MAIFDEELKALKEEILKLGSLAEAAIRDSVKSLVERESDLAREVIKRDSLINALEVKIDEECIRLIAIRQPMAKDLRFIAITMKIITDLERIGDLARNICKIAIELNEEPLLKPYKNIPIMAEIAQEMVRDALEAFVKESPTLSYGVIKKDNEIDALTANNFNEMVSYAIRDPKTISIVTKRAYVAKHLERIADHATNIAETVIYLVEGKIVRHTTMPQ